MKTKTGYKYSIQLKKGVIPINVFFKSFNKKVVRCWVKEGQRVFFGKAECNWKDGDTFDEKEGMELALMRALEKRKKVFDREFAELAEEYKEATVYGANGVFGKFKRMYCKGKLSCQKHPKEETDE